MSWVNLNNLYATKSELATKVPTSRTINGKTLSSNVTLAASDIKLSDSTTLQSAWDSISRVRYTLKSGSSSSIIKLRKGYLSSDGFIDIAIFGKLGYLNFRGFNIAGDAHCYNAQFALNLELANDYSWVDIVLSNGKSSITDCGLVASGDNCYLNAWKTTSDDVRVSGFVVFELAQHSISPAIIDKSSASGYYVCKIGRLAMLRVAISTSITNAWGSKVLGTLPAEYEPLGEVSVPVAIQSSNTGGVIMKLTHECNVIIEGKDTSWRSGWVFGVVTYVTV